MDSQRTILYIALFFTLFLIWEKWQEQHMPPQQHEQAKVASTAVGEGSNGSSVPVPAAPQATSDKAPNIVAAAPEISRGQRIKVSTDVFDAVIDTDGGDLRVLDLKKYPVAQNELDKPFVLLSDTSALFNIVQSGLIGSAEDAYPNHKTVYTTDKTDYRMQGDRLEVPLTWRSPSGVIYQKVYVFKRDTYLIKTEYRIDNTSSSPLSVYAYSQLVRTPPQVQHSTFSTGARSYTGAAAFTPETKFEKFKFEEIQKSPVDIKTPSGWVAMLQHYFVTAWIGADRGWDIYTKSLSGNRYSIGMKYDTPVVIAPGENKSIDLDLYAGPKKHQRLSQYGHDLTLTIDYGWLTPISAPLFWLLKGIHKFIGNWGWSIVILTILIKAVFFPLSAASYRSMAKMKNLAPRLKTLKERYGDDKQKYQQAVMEFYKTEKINPMGGCLPIVVQIPVFIALYWVLLESVELRQAPFILWIKDLSVKDPYFVLPIIMGLSMFIQQKLNPPQVDPMQQKIMMALPLVFTFFFLYFPAGLVLYWIVNNTLSIAQQWYINNKLVT